MCVWIWSVGRVFGALAQKAINGGWWFVAWTDRRVGVYCRRTACRKTVSAWLTVSAILAGAHVQAFEENGHNMVAQLAVPFLKENAQKELERLFGDDWSREIISMAASVQVELDRPKNKQMLPFQQTLFELGDEGFDPIKHCPNNVCSVGAILESREVLLRPNFTDSDKRQAVQYLMHYLVQLHIPVNVGLKRDLGGQKIYLKDSDLQPVNFAWIWNHDLYRKMNKRWFSYAQELYRTLQESSPETWIESMSIADWAFETHQLAVEQVYPIAAEGRYSAELINTGQALLEAQLMKAAYRTAALLNETFGDEVSMPSENN